MKLLYLSVLLLSTLVVQISSQPTEFDKITSKVLESLVNLVEKPFTDLEKEDPIRLLRDQVKMFSYKLSSKAAEIARELNKAYGDDSSLTPEKKEIKKKLLEKFTYLTKSFETQNQTKDIVEFLINRSLNIIPENI
uniref:Fatty-acid and retinol-binding protein 1 n=1 Tax=Schizaphis graminum TaxID=13262 RepID=A0A2S2P8C2_SCHGA